MPDIVDRSQKPQEVIESARLREVRDRAAAIPAGRPGFCIMCEEYSERLVGDACAPCRDLYNLP